MKKYTLFIIVLFCFQLSFSQNQFKILFVGNSLTGYNDLPGLFKELSIESGKSVYVDYYYRYGQPLRNYVNNQALIDKINEKKWDYVIFQSDDITAFDDMYDIEINTLTKCKEYVHDINPNSHIIYEMIWGLRDGYEGWYTYEEYIDLIYTGTLYIANQLDLTVAPVGWAWKECRSRNPNIELFMSDKAHPTYSGSYLGACVFFTIIWGEEIMNNSYYGDLSENEATTLQSIANDVVINNLDLWNYSEYIPSITDATLSDLKVDGETLANFNSAKLNYNVELAYGTTTVPTVSGTTNDSNAKIVITDATELPGKTTIVVTAKDGITAKTYEVNFTIATAIYSMNLERNIGLFPNPTNGIVNISFDFEMNSKCKIEVFNTLGSLIYFQELPKIVENILPLNLSEISKGMYLVKISTNNGSCVKNLIVE